MPNYGIHPASTTHAQLLLEEQKNGWFDAGSDQTFNCH
jgi:hypothetical protein